MTMNQLRSRFLPLEGVSVGDDRSIVVEDEGAVEGLPGVVRRMLLPHELGPIFILASVVPIKPLQ